MKAKMSLKIKGMGRWLWVVIIICVMGCGLAPGQSPLTQAPSGESPQPLPAEQETKLKAFIKKSAETKRRLWIEQLRQEVENVKELASLNAKTTQALENAVEQIVDAALQPWAQKLESYYRKTIADYPGLKIGNNLAQIDGAARGLMLLGCDGPAESAAWKDLLKNNLNPKELARLTQAQAEKKQDIDNEINELLQLWGEKLQPNLNKALVARVAAIKLHLNLPKERFQEVEALARTAMEKSMAACHDAVRKSLRSVDQGFRDNVRLSGQVPYLLIEQEQAPEQQEIWKKGIAKLLSAEELELLGRVERQKADKDAKEINDLLRPMAEQVREQIGARLNNRVIEITQLLKLTEPRQSELQRLAVESTEAATDSWRKRMGKLALRWDAAVRGQVLNGNRQQQPLSMAGEPEQQPEWKEGLLRLLSTEERASLQAAEQAVAARRTRILGQLLIIHVEKRVSFSTDQRRQLQPIAEGLINEQLSLFATDSENDYGRYSEDKFLLVATRAKESELKPILDPEQLKLWKAIPESNNDRLAQNENEGEEEQPDESSPKVDGEPGREPVDTDRVISDYLEKKSAQYGAMLLAKKMLKLQEIKRSVKIAPDTERRLETAARGATAAEMELWREEVEKLVRANLKTTGGDHVKSHLDNLRGHFMNMNQFNLAKPQEDWEARIQSELGDAEKRDRVEYLLERNKYVENAISGQLLLELDRLVGLRTQQWEALVPVISAIIKEYGDDLDNMFSGNQSYTWFSESQAMFIPLAGVPEVRMKEILSAPQWKLLRQSTEYVQGANYWRSIKDSHENATRVRRR